MKTKLDIKPCPYCGAAARLETEINDFGEGPEPWHYIQCIEIATCGNKTDTYHLISNVLSRWNRREYK